MEVVLFTFMKRHPLKAGSAIPFARSRGKDAVDLALLSVMSICLEQDPMSAKQRRFTVEI
jgi:hypothetical protein